jgi:hypothetical protein
MSGTRGGMDWLKAPPEDITSSISMEATMESLSRARYSALALIVTDVATIHPIV